MSNISTKMGLVNKGKRLYMGTVARFYISARDFEMPEYISLIKNPSWAELNKGKRSKKARRQ